MPHRFALLLRSFLCASFFVLVTLPVQATTLPELNLEQLIEATIQNNEALKAKSYRVQAEQEQLQQALGALRPNIQLNASYGRGQYSTQFTNRQEDDLRRASMALSQPLYAPVSYRSVKREIIRNSLIDLDFDLEQQTSSLETTFAYLELLQSLTFVEIAKKQLDDHQIKFQRLQALMDRGFATRMDYLEAQARRDEIRANLVTSHNNVIINKRKLERLIGMPIDQVALLPEDLWQRGKQLVAYKQWGELGVNQSLPVQVAHQEIELAQQELHVQRARHLPQVSMRLEFTESESYETTFQNNQKIQVDFVLPLYEGGITSSKIRAANNLLTSSRFSLQERERFVDVRIREILTELEATLANIDALQQSITSNESYLEAAERGLAIGLRGLADVLDARSRSYDTERRMVNEIYANLAAQFELMFLVGRYEPTHIRQFLAPNFSIHSLIN